jgi:hypothetical protein
LGSIDSSSWLELWFEEAEDRRSLVNFLANEILKVFLKTNKRCLRNILKPKGPHDLYNLQVRLKQATPVGGRKKELERLVLVVSPNYNKKNAY